MPPELLRRAEAGDLDAAAAVVATLAQQHRIKLRVTRSMPAGVSAYYSWSTRTATIPPIATEADFAVALHELSHGLCGPCPQVEPHRRDPTIRAWWKCKACETDAWARAMTLCPFSAAMFRRLQAALMRSRQIPSRADATHALDQTCGTLAWKTSVHQHRQREWRLQQQASVMHDVTMDRLRQRLREDAEGRARARRLFPEHFTE